MCNEICDISIKFIEIFRCKQAGKLLNVVVIIEFADIMCGRRENISRFNTLL